MIHEIRKVRKTQQRTISNQTATIANSANNKSRTVKLLVNTKNLVKLSFKAIALSASSE